MNETLNIWDRKTHSLGEEIELTKDDIKNIRGRQFKDKNDKDFFGTVVELNDGRILNIAQSSDIVKRTTGIMETPEGDGEVYMDIPKPRGL